jgi:hypothetical protein
MIIGTGVLAIAAMFATKANKKFAGIQTAYLNGISSSLWVVMPSTSLLTNLNTGGTLKTAFVSLYTTSSNRVHATLYSASGSTQVVYWK